MIQNAQNIIDKVIRPRLQGDGGDIEILGHTEDSLRLRLMGQCCACPLSSQTVEGFIKRVLLEQVPGLKDIEVETGLSNEMLELAKQYLRGGNKNDLERKI